VKGMPQPAPTGCGKENKLVLKKYPLKKLVKRRLKRANP